MYLSFCTLVSTPLEEMCQRDIQSHDIHNLPAEYVQEAGGLDQCYSDTRVTIAAAAAVLLVRVSTSAAAPPISLSSQMPVISLCDLNPGCSP